MRKAAKNKNLKIFASSLKREQAKEAKRAKPSEPAESGSDSDESVHVIERATRKLNISPHKTSVRERGNKNTNLVGSIRSCPKQKRIAAFKDAIKKKNRERAAEDAAAMEEDAFLERVNQATQEDMETSDSEDSLD